LKAAVFEGLVHDLRAWLRRATGRKEQPGAVIIDSRTLQASPERVNELATNYFPLSTYQILVYDLSR
jgi:hypothetical protein